MYRHFKQTMKEQCAMVTCMHKIMKMCKICIDRNFPDTYPKWSTWQKLPAIIYTWICTAGNGVMLRMVLHRQGEKNIALML